MLDAVPNGVAGTSSYGELLFFSHSYVVYDVEKRRSLDRSRGRAGGESHDSSRRHCFCRSRHRAHRVRPATGRPRPPSTARHDDGNLCAGAAPALRRTLHHPRLTDLSGRHAERPVALGPHGQRREQRASGRGRDHDRHQRDRERRGRSGRSSTFPRDATSSRWIGFTSSRPARTEASQLGCSSMATRAAET